jgi:hypothetical protein
MPPANATAEAPDGELIACPVRRQEFRRKQAGSDGLQIGRVTAI